MAEEEGEKQGIEQQLEQAVCSRLQHFKDQADSLTLESVRRLLEKDLGLEKFALDAHKRFIKQYLEKKMDSADDCKPETEDENVDKDVQIIKEGATVLPKQHESNNNVKRSSTGDEEMMEDSPILGVLTPKSEAGPQGPLSENKIEKAILERADHFIANSENLTLAGVRRLLEEDLGLDKNALDPFKKFISRQIDMVLSTPKAAKSVKSVKKKTSENLRSKKLKNVSSGEGSESSHSESDEIEDKVKSKKGSAPKRDIKKSEQPKKRKISKESHLDVSSKKPSKLPKRQKEEDNESDADGSLSEDDKSHSSVEKPAQRKEKPAPVYGKQVENLKSVIKACGMSVPPSIYKKAKEVPDNKREAFVVKELEGILLREGLSKNPSEKEIKDCRKRKETAKELEGIDMSNIISSSRRRSTFSFVAPVKPEARAKKEKVDAKESKKRDKKEKVGENEDEADKAVKEEEKEEKEEKVEKEEKEEEEEKKETEEDKESEEEVEDVEDEEDDDDEEEEEDDDDSEDFNEDDNEESD